MRRAHLALLICPVLIVWFVGLFMGTGAIVIWLAGIPSAIAIAFTTGVLMLQAGRRTGWCDWWHAIVAGALAPSPFIAVLLLGNDGYARVNGPYVSAALTLFGEGSALAVWLFGIRNNPDFWIRTPTSFHKGLAVAASAVALSLYIFIACEPTLTTGIVEGHARKPGYIGIKLSNGRRAVAENADEADFPIRPGCPATFTTRRALLSNTRLYWMSNYNDESWSELEFVNGKVSRSHAVAQCKSV